MYLLSVCGLWEQQVVVPVGGGANVGLGWANVVVL